MASISDTQDTASAGGHLKANFREYGMLLALVVIMAFFQYMTDGVLLKPLNLTNLILQNSYIIIMALGMLLVIVSGHIDLSVGSVAGFIGGLAGVLIVRNGFPVVPTILICLVVGGGDRRGPGLLDRLLAHPLLHRDAGRHAGVPRPQPRDAATASRSARSRSRSSS